MTICFRIGRNAGQPKSPPAGAGGLCSANSKRSVFRSRLRCGRCSGHFRLRTAQPPHAVRANAPEDSELRGLAHLGLAVLALAVEPTNCPSTRTGSPLGKLVRDGRAEAVRTHRLAGLPHQRSLKRKPQCLLPTDVTLPESRLILTPACLQTRLLTFEVPLNQQPYTGSTYARLCRLRQTSLGFNSGY